MDFPSAQPKVIRNISRAPVELIRQLGEFGVATVSEAQGRTGLMRAHMRPIHAASRIAGSAVTVLCQPGDNMMIHAAVEVCRPGDVLVVTTLSESTDGMFGELHGTTCLAHGIAGLIMDAGVRDVADLTRMGFPVWSKAICAQGTVKATAGSVNVDIVCAGAIVHPGDVIVADVDGVVVVDRRHAQEVVHLATKRIDGEQVARERLKAGELGVDVYGFRSKLADLGVQYYDVAPDESN